MNVVEEKVCGGYVDLAVVVCSVVGVVFIVVVVVDATVVLFGGAVVVAGCAVVDILSGATSLRGRGALSESNSSSKSSLTSNLLLVVVGFSVVVSASLTFSEVSDGL